MTWRSVRSRFRPFVSGRRQGQVLAEFISVARRALVLPHQLVRTQLVPLEEARLRLAFAQHGRTGCALDDITKEVVALGLMAALREQARSVGESVLGGVMIEELIGVLAHLA